MASSDAMKMSLNPTANLQLGLMLVKTNVVLQSTTFLARKQGAAVSVEMDPFAVKPALRRFSRVMNYLLSRVAETCASSRERVIVEVFNWPPQHFH